LGNNCYKIRIRIVSKNKGKSGGGRVIVNVHIINKMVSLLTISDKTEKENITDSEIFELFNLIPD
jgi:hypothetical protein